MHAASVHPEPGSNSLKIVYQAVLPALIQSLRVILLLDYLKELFLKFKRIFGVFFVHFVVVQFSMSDSLSVELPLRDSLFILPHLLPFVKGFLKLFSKFFAESVVRFPVRSGLHPLFPDSSAILSLSPLLVNPFFEIS